MRAISSMGKIKITKSPQHKTVVISKENQYGYGYIITINKRELEEFLKDEYEDIK